MPYHVELRDQRDVVRVFNLEAEDVELQFVAPLRAGVQFVYQDKKFEPRKARLTVIKGKKLAPGELSLGQGWTNAVKRGDDVTMEFLSVTGVEQPTALTTELATRLKDRIIGRVAGGPLPLGEGIGLTADMLAGHRVSERLSAIELTVWEMLHAGLLALHLNAGSDPLPKDQWESVVLDADTWLAAPGPDSPVISATA